MEGDDCSWTKATFVFLRAKALQEQSLAYFETSTTNLGKGHVFIEILAKVMFSVNPA